ncbi:MAG: TIGR03808 family TAT-translocated repetitive protein [Hyphomicrobiaceae bacterium]|nr:TIGR03808 family TAT-translocated repetitive protein [Hyphomicrobiaceae bacterium]
MSLDRRSFLTLAAAAPLSIVAGPVLAQSLGNDLRGAIDAGGAGIRPGETDQTRALRKLLEQGTGAGRPVFLPPGRYAVADLVLPDGARLIGVPGKSRLVFAGGSGAFVSAKGARNLTLDGIVIDADRKPVGTGIEGALRLIDVAEMSLRDVLITDTPNAGLYAERSGGRISLSTIERCGDAALWSRDARALVVADNTIRDCGNGGVLIHRTTKGEDGSQVRGNRIERIGSANGGTGQWGNGVNVYQAGNVLVADNRIVDCAFTAVRSNGGDGVQIIANQALRCGETAIYSEFAFTGAVVANNLVDGAANGISIANFNEGGRLAVVSGNIVRNLRSTGPYPPQPPGFGWGIWAEADTAVTGNVVENAPLYGIGLGYGPFLRDVTATGNIIRNVGIGIAVTVVDGARAAIISDNIIRDAKRGAIVGMRWADPVTPDLARAGSPAPAHLTVERNRAS